MEKDKGIEVTDEQIIEIIAKEVKKRKDSLP
ncbi:GatB/YqeY domain-containing protein, partial [bacterium]|nr:GatB/YqeY domain-containing protein [bacterium]